MRQNLIHHENVYEVMATRVVPDHAVAREGELLEHGGQWYKVIRAGWPETNAGQEQNLVVAPRWVKGTEGPAPATEPGFSERDDLPVDKGFEPT